MSTPISFKPLCQRGNSVDELWVLCPFAGGSHSAFSSWSSLPQQELPMNSLVLLATYPGRDQRMKERALASISEIAGDLFDALMKWIASTPQNRSLRLRICGHSMERKSPLKCVNILRSTTVIRRQCRNWFCLAVMPLT